MKPAWDQLAEAWKDSPSVLIGDVDCTAEGGESLCSDNGVKGYPTIKYYTVDSGRSGYDYTGGRSFEDLNSFTEQELVQECNPKSKEFCSEKELAYISKIAGQGKDKWAAEAKRLGGLSSQPAAADKRAWLMQRLSILEYLLERRTPRARRMRFSTKIAIAIGAIAGTVVLNVLLLRHWQRRKEVKPEAKEVSTAEGKAETEAEVKAKRQVKEEEAKQD